MILRLCTLAFGAALLPAPGAARATRVAATIPPLADIVRQVAGDTVDVIAILPPGASPHTFEPTPGTVRRLAGARAVFLIGYGVDDWAADLARAAGAGPLTRVDAGIPLRRIPGDRGEGGSVDPHYWLSCVNARRIAATVAERLAALLPERAAQLASRREAYARELDAADLEIRSLLASLPRRDIATFHDGFRYFAAAYNLNIVAVFEASPGREPGPRFVREFQSAVARTGVRVVFSEPQLSVDALRPIARDLHVTLSILDPLGGVPGRESFLDLMRFNARQVRDALRAR